jgi:hypothetical protein
MPRRAVRYIRHGCGTFEQIHHDARQATMKRLLIIVLAATTLAGCVVVPARHAYYRPGVVVY